jgi:hypothetical protein
MGWLLAAGWSTGAMAAEPLPAPKGYVCGKVAAPIAVDGALDDPGWASAPWTDDFVDIEGSRRPLPRLRTRAKLAWDAEFLYVAAELAEPHVWGNLTAHDSVIFQDNDFELFLDPDGDNHKYFEVEVNALNTEWDLFLRKPYRDGGPAENSWEIPGLKKAVQVRGTINDPSDTDIGWTVELAIPWSAVAQDAGTRTPPGDGDRWRINFSRVEWDTAVEGGQYVKVKEDGKVRPEHNWVWSPQGVIDMHQPERWGDLQFSAEAPGAAAYRPDPDAAVRDRLMAIYHARKALAKAGKPWQGTLEELDLDPGAFRVRGASLPVVRLTPGGFEAVMSGPPVEGHTPRIWAVDQDGRLTAR